MSSHSSFAAIPPATLEKQTVRKLFLRLLPFLFLLYIVSYVDRINVGFAKLQMQGQLGFSERVFGVGFGVFFVGYFFLQVPSNLLLERIGVRKWIAGLMVVWGLVSCSMIFVRTPFSFYLLRFLLGAAEAGFFPGMIVYMKYWFPARARAQAVAWFMTANPLAGVFGSPISGALLGVHGLGLSGWQWLFVLEAVPAILLGFVVYWVLPERPKDARWLSDEQKLWLSGELQNEFSGGPGLQRSELLAAFLSGRVWILALVYFGLSSSVYGAILWLPSAIHGLAGLGNRATGWAITPGFIAMAIAMVLVGMHSDKKGERRWHTAMPAFFGMASLVIGAVLRTPLAIIIGMSLGMIGGEAMCGPFWALATQQLKRQAAPGVAIINSVANLGGFFGPLLVSLGYRSGMFALAGVLAMSATLAAVVGKERQQPAA
jgi:ACS family tartrate transporter-like MFS transporter